MRYQSMIRPLGIVILAVLFLWGLRTDAPHAVFNSANSQDSRAGSDSQDNADASNKRSLSNRPVATASLVPTLILENLTRDADLIVAGEIKAVREEKPTTIDIHGLATPTRHLAAELQVHRMIKGKFDRPSLSFQFFLPEVGPIYQDIVTGQFGLFFLRVERQREFSVLDPYYPFVVAAPDVPAVRGNDFDRVVAEVAHVLSSPATSVEQGRQAVKVLNGVKTQAATAALRKAANESNTTIRLEAVAALLWRNDISSLDVAEDALLRLPQLDGDPTLQKIAFALKDGVQDLRAIPALTRLLRAADVRTRRAAAAALRHTGVTDAIEALSNALEDSDREVRYHAVMGLALITKSYEWGTAVDRYEANEDRYLNHWRAWAKTR
ncbi:MAG: HEAT repeat domain-containing protein [Acidobacteriota bacterium]